MTTKTFKYLFLLLLTMGSIKELKKYSLALAFLTAFSVSKSMAKEYSEKVFVSGKPYTVTLNNVEKYEINPYADKVTAGKAVKTATIKYELEEGYFKEDFYKDGKNLDRKLLEATINATAKCVKETALSPVEDLKDPRALIGTAKGVAGEGILGVAKGFLTSWWIGLPDTLENRSVDPKIYVASSAGQTNLYSKERIKKFKNMLKDGLTYEESEIISKELYKIKAFIPSLVTIVDEVNRSKDNRFQVDERDLKEFSILEWKGYGNNMRISDRDKPKLQEIQKRIWNRIYETSEFKKYRRGLERQGVNVFE